VQLLKATGNVAELVPDPTGISRSTIVVLPWHGVAWLQLEAM
jgi:hypothetical protein